ncbi:hypothetical protein FSP39_000159 [Pinctada imbricata]|uniref:Peptidase M12B domain-containing protein n=1 Tax=Pinctada imbricata TaxID=66713 RepID=A0AA88XC97_PINIB|nr:hypothetical protein FSP39_000159 [Pinctada imbricata]
MLFSSYIVYMSYAYSGLSSMSAICTTNSQSVTEENLYFSATIAAHQLGHSLGALHDGEGNGCSGNDAFIMAASLGGQTEATASNPWKFSSCSTQYFTSLINTLNSGSNCLTTLSTGFDPTALAQYDGLLPGQIYDADTQCEQIQGKGSYLKRVF